MNRKGARSYSEPTFRQAGAKARQLIFCHRLSEVLAALELRAYNLTFNLYIE